MMHSQWQFWFFSRNQSSSSQDDEQETKSEKPSYREQLKSLGKIPTVEHFFNYYVFLKKPSDMPRDIDLFFFRHNELPMWEESPHGGVWIVKV